MSHGGMTTGSSGTHMSDGAGKCGFGPTSELATSTVIQLLSVGFVSLISIDIAG